MSVLRSAAVIGADLPGPHVVVVKHRLRDASSWEALRDADVVVATPMVVSAEYEGVSPPPADLFDLVLFDEAHHVPARTWSSVISEFSNARVGLFTATPYRRDLKALPGEIAFSYSLHDAIADRVFQPVEFVAVDVPLGGERDTALADAAVGRLQDPLHTEAGSQLLVRAGTIAAARELVALYASRGLEVGVVDSHHSLRHNNRVIASMRAGELRGVVAVGILGEGFDLPSLKIAAYHDRHKSLPATLQFIGRVARVSPEHAAPAELLAVNVEVQDETRALYAEDQSWAELLPAIADAAIAEERDRRQFVLGFTPPPPDTFSLHAVSPAVHAEVFAIDGLQVDLDVSLDSIGRGRVMWQSVDADHNVLAIVTQVIDGPPWLRAAALDAPRYELHIAVHIVEHDLLFLSTTSPSARRLLLSAIGVESARAVSPSALNRMLHAVELVSYYNLGLRNARGPGTNQPAYKIVAHRNVESTLMPSESRNFTVGHLIARRRARQGEINSIGVALRSSKVWSPESATLLSFRNWCAWIAGLLAATDGAEWATAPLLDVRMPLPLTAFPLVPLAAVVDSRLYGEGYQIALPNGDQANLLDVELIPDRVDDYEVLIHCEFDGAPIASVRLQAVGGVSEPSGVEVVHSQTQERLDLAELFADYPPTIYFGDGSSTDGELLNRVSESPAQLPADVLDAWSWDGVNIRAEAKPKDDGLETILQRTVAWATNRFPDSFVIVDDGAGELADVVVLEVENGRPNLTLVHCKFSSENEPGHRVEDLYDVVGQTIRSARWAGLAAVWKALSDRLGRRPSTRLVQGDVDELRRLLGELRTTGDVPRTKIIIVQPGLITPKLHEWSNCYILVTSCFEWVEVHGATLRIIGSGAKA